MESLLEVRDVELRFGGITALAGVGLTVAEGETVAVIGPNGSGKTSLFNCITGLYRPTSGSISFRGESLLGLSPDRVTARGVARTFQNLRLFLHMTVLDNLMLGRHLHFRKNLLAAALRLRGEEVRHRAKVEEIIEFLDLEAWRDSRVAGCSYGVQKRVELGRALCTEPRLLLLDEPMAGMGREDSERMVALLRRLKGRETILLIEHDMDVVFDVCSEISVLHFGELLETGTPEQIKSSQRVQEIYLGTD